MSTTIRPKISAKNQYSIDKHRYYELKHFVMQYPGWKKKLLELDGFSSRMEVIDISNLGSEHSDPVQAVAEEREYYLDRVKMVDRVAQETDSVIGPMIVRGIVDGVSFDILRVRYGIPCGKDMYYELYRKFFWLLDKARK